jgi:O-antigen ligase
MTTEANVQSQPGFLNRPISILFIILAIVGLWGFIYSYAAMVILAAIIVLLFFGLSRPVWAITALILQQFTITSYMITTPFGIDISLRLILLILVGLVIWRFQRLEKTGIGPKAKYLIWPALVLIGLALLSDLINSDSGTLFKNFRDMITGLMIMLFIPLAIRNIRDMKILCGAAFFIISASSLIGIMQHFNILGMQSATLVLHTWPETRIPGMAETELELSYILSSGLLILAGVFLLKGFGQGMKGIIFGVMLIIAIATYFTYTRSAIIAISAGLISLFLFIKTRLKGELVLIAIILISGILASSPLADQYISGRSQDTQEDSTVSRLILWQAGLSIALDHPLIGIGSGKEQFTSISEQYQSKVDRSLIAYEKRAYWGYRTLGNEPPHNDFLNIWLSFGIFALIVFIWLFIVTIRNYLSAYRKSRSSFIKGLSIGLAAALIAYVVNAFYHNVMAAMSLFWILAGFSLAINKITLLRASSINNT